MDLASEEGGLKGMAAGEDPPWGMHYFEGRVITDEVLTWR